MALLALAQDTQCAVSRVIIIKVQVGDLLPAQTASIGDGDEGSVAHPVNPLLGQMLHERDHLPVVQRRPAAAASLSPGIDLKLSVLARVCWSMRSSCQQAFITPRRAARWRLAV